MEKARQDPSKFTFQPEISGKIPDFLNLQKRFESLLESKKQNFVPTIPEAPRCSENTVCLIKYEKIDKIILKIEEC